MAKRVSVDRWMFTVTMILVFIGLVMIFSASAVMAKERFGSAYEFLLKQLVWAVAGLAVMVLAMKVDYKYLQHPVVVFSFLGLTTLLLISVFFLDRAHGTDRCRCSPRSWPNRRSFCSWRGFWRTKLVPWTIGAIR